MRNKFFHFLLCLAVCVSCDSDNESPSGIGSLFIEDVGYKMSALIIYSDLNEDNPNVEITLWNGKGSYHSNENVIKGKGISFITFDFDLPEGTTDLPEGTFVFGEDTELNEALIRIKYNWDTDEQDFYATGLESGTLEIVRNGAEYEFNFIGVIDGTNVLGSYKGKAKVYEDD